MRQKQDLLSQSLECYIYRVVLIPGFARERKKEVVFSLSTLISYYPSVTKEDNSIVLYCIDGKPIYIKSWCTSGVRCIEDLLNVNLKFLTLSEMKEKYNFEFPFTTYYGLLRAIPNEWKSALRVKAGVHDQGRT